MSDPVITRTMDTLTPWYVRNPINSLHLFAAITNGAVPSENLPSGWNRPTNQTAKYDEWPEASYGKPYVPTPEDEDEGPGNSDWSEEEEENGEDSDSDMDGDVEMGMLDGDEQQQSSSSQSLPRRRKRRQSRQPYYRLLVDPVVEKCCDNHCGFCDTAHNWLGWDPMLEYTSLSSFSGSSSSGSIIPSNRCVTTFGLGTGRYIPPSHYTSLLQLSQMPPFITREFASRLFFNSVFEFPEGPSLFLQFVRDRPAVLLLMRGVILRVECSADFMDTVTSELEAMLTFLTTHEEIKLRFFTVVLSTASIHMLREQMETAGQCFYKSQVLQKLKSWAPLFRQLKTEEFLLELEPLTKQDTSVYQSRPEKQEGEDLELTKNEVREMWLPDCLRSRKGYNHWLPTYLYKAER